MRHLNDMNKIEDIRQDAEPHTSITQPRKISLHEAQRVAVKALLSAEKRRQENREREAVFWAALETALNELE